jgi:uncharacterized oxidoreductase
LTLPVLTAEKLTESCLKIFSALGVPNAEAEVVTRAMVDANLVGHDSHGVIHLPLKYVPEIESGLIELGAEIEIKRESPSMAVIDGNWGFGPVIATYAVELAVQKAKTNDVSSVVVSRSNEVGRLGGYALIAAESDMICLLTVNDHGAGSCVVPFGGVEPRLSTNPLACAIPLSGREPLLLDMSTSVVASGKVRVQQHRKEAVPEGWIVDSAGTPTTNVEDFYADPPGALLPFGGIAAQKGFGLSLVVDILSGALSGANCTREGETRPGNGIFVTVINVGSFAELSGFNEEVDRFIEYVKSAQKSPGVEEIFVPGERGFRERERRERDGIYIEEDTWEQIKAIAKRYQVEIAD